MNKTKDLEWRKCFKIFSLLVDFTADLNEMKDEDCEKFFGGFD